MTLMFLFVAMKLTALGGAVEILFVPNLLGAKRLGTEHPTTLKAWECPTYSHFFNKNKIKLGW
jgi:hypothetical protein